MLLVTIIKYLSDNKESFLQLWQKKIVALKKLSF